MTVKTIFLTNMSRNGQNKRQANGSKQARPRVSNQISLRGVNTKFSHRPVMSKTCADLCEYMKKDRKRYKPIVPSYRHTCFTDRVTTSCTGVPGAGQILRVRRNIEVFAGSAGAGVEGELFFGAAPLQLGIPGPHNSQLGWYGGTVKSHSLSQFPSAFVAGQMINQSVNLPIDYNPQNMMFIPKFSVKITSNSEAVLQRSGKFVILSRPFGAALSGLTFSNAEQDYRAKVFKASLLDQDAGIYGTWVNPGIWSARTTAPPDFSANWSFLGIYGTGLGVGTSFTFEISYDVFVFGPYIPRDDFPIVDDQAWNLLHTCFSTNIDAVAHTAKERSHVTRELAKHEHRIAVQNAPPALWDLVTRVGHEILPYAKDLFKYMF